MQNSFSITMVKPSRKNNGPVRVSGVLTAMFVLF